MTDYDKRELNTVRRRAERGRYDRPTVHAILDAAFLCHVGFVIEGQPFVIPTLYARDGDTIFVHGSSVSRMLKGLSEGIEACVTVTLTDGIVLARSAFHHSMNYRSVTAFGKGSEVTDAREKLHALKLISDNVVPGRWEDARQPTENELNVTSVIAIPIDTAAAKIREGGPKDDRRDLELPVWAGVIPLEVRPGEPVPDKENPTTAEIPEYVKRMLG